jgi:hypothetical protein
MENVPDSPLSTSDIYSSTVLILFILSIFLQLESVQILPLLGINPADIPAMKPPSSALRYLLFLSSLLSARAASDTPPKDALSPCVARSASTGLYYDLGALSLSPPPLKDGQKVYKGDRDTSWHSKGHDHPANFTINICAPVIEDVTDVEGVESERWGNVSAYYELDGRTYSLGYVGLEYPLDYLERLFQIEAQHD